VATEGINAQMAVPSNALPYFSTATRSLPMFSQLRINTDKEVSREEFMETKPFKA
jgi:predicted sulfurtransferase